LTLLLHLTKAKDKYMLRAARDWFRTNTYVCCTKSNQQKWTVALVW